ncbi:hypothetical protein [Halopelagius inordinatus]|uniref:hypothetical protein n=1 Tax=Halopelagius inordinatus TaxID=553467 RepID=UPI000AD59681|nr:hypothetical protein [Halopelagius inordinatus]
MSTHIRTPAETESRTETRPTGQRDASGEREIPNAADADDVADDVRSRMDRCQRQFSSTDTRRLRNLADEANESMPNPE